MKNLVLVTGASGGIGQSIVQAFSADGWAVAIHYNKNKIVASNMLEELRAEGCSAEIFQCDLADGKQVEQMFHHMKQTFGKDPDVLVNNAGVGMIKLFTDVTEEEWDYIFDVNVKGMFHCCRLALPSMISQKRGRIINISSMWGQTGASCEVPYSAAKAAVIGFTKALAKEVGPSGVTVNCVAPGLINTDMNCQLTSEEIGVLIEDTPMCRMGTGADVAAAVLFLASEKSSFITGQTLGTNGGMVI